ncbi:MAG: tetratricopeptide repeat protein [Bacteroidota bacterium]
MSKQIKYSEYIQNYLDGEMSREDISEFQLKLNQDDTFLKNYKFHRKINDLLNNSKVLEFNNVLNEIEEKFNHRPSGFSSVILKNWYKIAAVIFVLLIASIVLMNYNVKKDNNEIFNTYYKCTSSPNLTRSAEKAENDLQSGLLAYDSKRYKESTEILNKVLINKPEDATAKFYLGMTYIETGKYEKAVESLSVLANKDDNFYTDQACWYLALCYIKTDQNQLAVKYLKKLTREKTGYYKTRAEDILRIIKIE